MSEIKHKEMIIKIITMLVPKAKIYLFGSYARQSPNPGSDIDIAIDAGRRLTLDELKKAIRLIEALPISQKVDIIDLHRVSEKMQDIIRVEGIVWN